MMYSLQVENIKCGGCANSITKKLLSLEGVADVQVDIENGEVRFEADNENQVEQVKAQLAGMGYPEAGTIQGMASVGAKAKSFISCAVGSMSDKA
ncbi:heavy metal transporter [Hydrogenovibrio marinus]|uniref:Heavy metal transporter n=2 Tax=Hydrogenovibrio marinus TaxID=28885 RepID=A0A066ZQG9_HYDMR|nr:heavy metal transporter [Hydrogenovibrio marinus]